MHLADVGPALRSSRAPVGAVVPTALRRALAFAAALACATSALDAATLTNDRYRLDLADDGTVTLHVDGVPPQTVQPRFAVLSSDRDPGYHVNHQNYHVAPRTAPRWTAYEEELGALNRRLASPVERELRRYDAVVTADAKGARTWTYRDNAGKVVLRVSGAYARGTTNPLLAGERTDLTAPRVRLDGRTVHWEFAPTERFTLTATLTLPAGDADPRIEHRLVAHAPGWYSVAFTGAPDLPRKQALSIPQECAGRGRRQFNHLVNEAFLRLPRAHLAAGAWNTALVVDARESPFRIPVRQNSRFGLMLQLADDRLRPVSFAPIMGGPESRLAAGDVRTFALHCIVRPGDWKDTYVYLARTHAGFRDQRDNSGPGSLNRTLEATMDFLADRRGGNRALWHAEQKYYDYWTDNSGIFKPFSPLFGLGAAIVTDDEDFYWSRALPQVEFALSRANNTFAPYEVEQNGQVKARNRELGRPYLNAAQLVQLAGFYGHRTPLIAAAARKAGFDAKDFTALLARHELTGDPADLAAARRAADAELKQRRPTGEGDDYLDWLELYLATGEPRYLGAAQEGAYGLSTTINLSPATPDGTLVADAGGRVAVHEHSFGRHRLWGFQPPRGVPSPEQSVPAWRLSLTGLQSPAYRGEYWMNHHGQLLRLAALAQDDFLRDIARWGMVGRFGNYPGDNRSNLSLIPESADAIERPIWDWNFATVNPGHAWEFAGEVIDFLVSDAFHRSRGAIDFPGRPMPGTSFRCRAYGDRPGTFHGERGVHLWLPRRLVTSEHRAFDYLAGHGNGKLYLAFWNQSFTEETLAVALDPARVDLSGVTRMEIWRDNRSTGPQPFDAAALTVRVPAKGIVAFALEGARVRTQLHAKLFDPTSAPLGPQSFAQVQAPFGRVYAQLLSPGRGLTSAFVYTDALPDDTISATLRYRQGDGEWMELHDAIFPYEFSPPYTEGAGPLELDFAVETAAQRVEHAPAVTLRP
ncbi:MAG: hypothetical protein KBC32_06235 [Candidatus Didemnitutus sp.]|nr:hypothetical protein [Candidatus Didemnitutus sp.]